MANQDQFNGDLSRNEVEIDLAKFMAMVSEIGELKAKIMELENDKEPDNPWQKYIWFSNMIDAWRIFPRAFLSVYIILLYKCKKHTGRQQLRAFVGRRGQYGRSC